MSPDGVLESNGIIEQPSSLEFSPFYERNEDTQELLGNPKDASIEVPSNIRRFGSKSEPVTYGWSNINAWTGSVNQPDGTTSQDKRQHRFSCFKEPEKHILKNVSGCVYPGELVAIMGASGAGKSTFLDVLSFRNASNVRVSGTRVINGTPIESNTITSISAYVQQMDLFFGVLTVKEHLVFQARVRMHAQIPHSERMERVEQVLQEFQLNNSENTQIGTRWLKGLSGGEMKRLSIASEVLTDPMFMCCDEPTSGLDSTSAQNVMSILKELSGNGKSVICTVHQPPSQLFSLFDKVLLMAEGRVAFLGTTAEALDFFKSQGFNCPPMYNPADFLVDTLAIKNGEENRAIVHSICDSFEKWRDAQEFSLFTQSEALNLQSTGNAKSPYKASWLKQMRAVLPRSWISYVRDPMVLKLRFAQTLILALFMGTIFYQLDLSTYAGVQNLSGASFMLMSCLTYQNIIGTLDSFCSELPVFMREHLNGEYSTSVYFLSKMTIEFPFNILFPVLLTSISYFMIGFDPDLSCFLKTLLVMILVANVCSGVGYTLSCVASSVTVALILVPVAIFPFVLFSGFLLRPGTGPVFLSWLEHISWFFYGFESLTTIHLENVQEIQCLFENATCPPNGLAVLEGLGFSKDNFTHDIVAMSLLAVGSQMLAWVTLLYRTCNKSGLKPYVESCLNQVATFSYSCLELIV